MNRNRNVDIFRAIALLLVMVYHGWVLMGSCPFKFSIITLIVSLGGEIGVTAFFALSGYGIYCSLLGMEEKTGKVSYIDFWKKRVKRIVPHYYLSIAVVVLVSLPSYLSLNGVLNIVSHLLFVHNLLPGYSGSINGVLWTMGVIVQFYWIAPILFKGFRKYGIKMELACIVLTVLMKYIMYAVVLPYTGHSEDLAFFSGRQLITALDNFTVGMFVAHVTKNKKTQMSGETAALVCILSVAEVVVVCKAGMAYGIHTNNSSGYIWHSLLSLGLGGIILSISYIKHSEKSFIYRGLLWLSKYEYEIYIWHLLILNKLIGSSAWIQGLIGTAYFRLIYLVYLPLSIAVGVVVSKGLNGLRRTVESRK